MRNIQKKNKSSDNPLRKGYGHSNLTCFGIHQTYIKYYLKNNPKYIQSCLKRIAQKVLHKVRKDIIRTKVRIPRSFRCKGIIHALPSELVYSRHCKRNVDGCQIVVHRRYHKGPARPYDSRRGERYLLRRGNLLYRPLIIEEVGDTKRPFEGRSPEENRKRPSGMSKEESRFFRHRNLQQRLSKLWQTGDSANYCSSGQLLGTILGQEFQLMILLILVAFPSYQLRHLYTLVKGVTRKE